eukprot:tig00020965_g16831.t1
MAFAQAPIFSFSGSSLFSSKSLVSRKPERAVAAPAVIECKGVPASEVGTGVDLNTILKKLVISEKTFKLSEEEKTLTFMVDRRATKPQIREVLEKVYGVGVARVNTLNVHEAKKSRGKGTRHADQKFLKSGKKAYVTLSADTPARALLDKMGISFEGEEKKDE